MKAAKQKPEQAPQFDDVLKRMLSSPPAPHAKPRPAPKKDKKAEGDR
ncbi:MAG: hypothetical protein H0X13_20535 [Ramlibacter sp.]|nr:hypothetical protein [Ramlibacter sp.]